MNDEAEYLALQAQRSKQRLQRTATTLVDELLAPLDARPIVRRHPHTSLAGATLVGFVVARILRRRPRAPEPERAGGVLHGVFVSLHRRLRRIVASTFGAAIVASLRGGGPKPVPSATDGAEHDHAV
jgi:hypothetical protein